MSKTVTLRVENSIYEMIKKAAQGQRRNLSNFIEFATLQYLSSTAYVNKNEMDDILEDKELVQDLKDGFVDLSKGNYKIV